jgi:Flp pilus assembly protein TadD
MGLVLESMERFEEALPHLQRVVEVKPSNPEAHFSLAVALAGTGRTNEARQHFDTTLKLDPHFANRLFESGKALAAQGQLEAARARFSATLSLNPLHSEAHDQWGLLLAQQGRLDEAADHFRESLRLRPTASAEHHLGLIHTMKHQPLEAIGHYHQALQLQPDWPEALNDLAWLLATQPQPEVRDGAEAVRLAERACELTHRKEARFLGTLDASYAEAGRFQDALVTARQARDLAAAAGQEEIARAARERMEGYEVNKPFRQK